MRISLTRVTGRIKSVVFIITLFFSISSYSQVVINEFSASNLNQFADNYGKYEDWIELYNKGNTSVNIGGYYLSDDSLNNMKYQIPAGTVLASHAFIRFWTSGRDLVVGTHYHTNFKITQCKNNNEFVVLSNASGVRIDLVEISQRTQLGHSYGRTQNGLNFWSVFKIPTPNSSNNTSTPYADYADKPDFSLPAGFYTGPQIVYITTNEPNADIHYTLDGSLPTSASPIYTGPITISNTKVLKAITISADPEILPSFIRYETFFINVNHTLRVVSVAGDQLNTLANGSGSLEPKGTFEYFDTAGVRKANTYGEFNKHGQDSWANSQRSLDFASRDEMGYNHSIEEELFANSTRSNFQKIILRAAGDDNYPADHHAANEGSAHMRDAYIHSLADYGNLNLDLRRSEKCIVYINGEYWGVYDLRENPDDHDFTDYYYGQDKYHLQYILTWGGTWAEYGGQQALDDWDALYDFIMNNNMADPINFQYVSERYDFSSLVDYVIVNSFTVCSDWMNWNTGWWRGLDSTGTHKKWGFILWDNDATFGHYINYTGIPNTTPTAAPCNPEGLTGGSDPNGHIKCLNRFMANPVFKQYYVGRQIDLMNTVFSQNNMISQLDSTAAIIDPEMNQHAIRWSGTYAEWYQNYQDLRDFIIQRTNYLPTSSFNNCYNTTGPYQITLITDPPYAGFIKLNSLYHTSFPWTGTYFGGNYSLLDVIPSFGYQFDHWSSNNQNFLPSANTAQAMINLTGNDTIVAHFGVYSAIEDPNRKNTNTPTVTVAPNVFSQQAYITYELPAAGKVSMRIYNAIGELMDIVMPENTSRTAGTHSEIINWSGSSNPPGIYFLDFVSGDFRKTIKLIYIQ